MPYSQLGNTMLRDKRLSLAARGALGFILSHPENWSFNQDWLRRETGIGREKAQALVRELMEAGYCRRSRVRDAKGYLGAVEYWFSDDPQALNPQSENPSLGPQDVAHPRAGKPSPGNPRAGKPTVYKKKVSEEETKEETPLPPKGGGGGLDLSDEVKAKPRRRGAAKPATQDPAPQTQRGKTMRGEITEAVFDEARLICPGRDVRELHREWREWSDEQDEPAANPAAAFLAYCARQKPLKGQTFKSSADLTIPLPPQLVPRAGEIAISRYSPAWDQWLHWADAHHPASAKLMRSSKIFTIFTATRWPVDASTPPRIPAPTPEKRTVAA